MAGLARAHLQQLTHQIHLVVAFHQNRVGMIQLGGGAHCNIQNMHVGQGFSEDKPVTVRPGAGPGLPHLMVAIIWSHSAMVPPAPCQVTTGQLAAAPCSRVTASTSTGNMAPGIPQSGYTVMLHPLSGEEIRIKE